jgi:hypothetical protein
MWLQCRRRARPAERKRRPGAAKPRVMLRIWPNDGRDLGFMERTCPAIAETLTDFTLIGYPRRTGHG